MALVLDLSPEEEKQIEANAEKRGLDVNQYIRERLELQQPKSNADWVETRRKEIMASKPTAVDPADQPVIDLMYQWMVEDVTGDPEELERRNVEWQELEKNLSDNRVNFPVPVL